MSWIEYREKKKLLDILLIENNKKHTLYFLECLLRLAFGLKLSIVKGSPLQFLKPVPFQLENKVATRSYNTYWYI